MKRLGLLVAIATSLLIGCASAKLTVVRPLEAPVGEVSLAINPPASGQMTAEERSRLRSTLTTRLVDGGVSVVAKDEAGASSLVGDLEHYDPGNRALRYWVGFGAGRGRFSSRWIVRDPIGSELGTCRVDGSISGGSFGGSYDEVLEKAGDRLADFLLNRD
jgi:hypothetical protein